MDVLTYTALGMLTACFIGGAILFLYFMASDLWGNETCSLFVLHFFGVVACVMMVLFCVNAQLIVKKEICASKTQDTQPAVVMEDE